MSLCDYLGLICIQYVQSQLLSDHWDADHLTFLALQRYPGLQVVHLELQAFECAVRVPGLPFVGDEDGDDGYEEDASACSDPDDSGKCQRAVRVDVESARGVLQPANQNLKRKREWKH